MKVAVDTTYILGRGAVKDTYNLLADGIVWSGHWPNWIAVGLETRPGALGSSVKGEAGIDWDNKKGGKPYCRR